MTEDVGELYDGEKEGGDARNEQSHKRPAEASSPPEKKFRAENEAPIADATQGASENVGQSAATAAVADETPMEL